MTQTTSKDQNIPEPIQALMSLSEAAIGQMCTCDNGQSAPYCLSCQQLQVFNQIGELFAGYNDASITGGAPLKYERVGDVSVARQLLEACFEFANFLAREGYWDIPEYGKFRVSVRQADSTLANAPKEFKREDVEELTNHFETAVPDLLNANMDTFVDEMRIMIAKLRGES